MAYDQHYSGGPPGPIAGYRWVANSLATSARAASRRRSYGSACRATPTCGAPGARPRVLSVVAARKLAGRRARFSPQAAEWHARLGHGRRLWFSDARPMRKRIALAR